MSVTRVFVGDDEQYFPDLARWVSPGDEVEFDEDPEDPRFVTPANAKKAGVKPRKPVEPEVAPDIAASEPETAETEEQ